MLYCSIEKDAVEIICLPINVSDVCKYVQLGRTRLMPENAWVVIGDAGR